MTADYPRSPLHQVFNSRAHGTRWRDGWSHRLLTSSAFHCVHSW